MEIVVDHRLFIGPLLRGLELALNTVEPVFRGHCSFGLPGRSIPREGASSRFAPTGREPGPP